MCGHLLHINLNLIYLRDCHSAQSPRFMYSHLQMVNETIGHDVIVVSAYVAILVYIRRGKISLHLANVEIMVIVSSTGPSWKLTQPNQDQGKRQCIRREHSRRCAENKYERKLSSTLILA